MTASEREREAREAVLQEGECGVEGGCATCNVALDAYRAAVRSAVLAEVRKKIVPHFEWGEITEEQFLAALTALEATDANS